MTTTPRIYLQPVPSSERRTVKLLGARWDAEKGLWWVSSEWPDVQRFARWLP